jgi:hypothetical protein
MENEINITNARYVVDPINDVNEAVIATIDGQEMSVPLDPANRHYAEILKQVEAGTLTVADAD